MVVPAVPVVPDGGLTNSHPDGWLEAAVVNVVDGELVNVTVCDPGELPPATAENESVEGVAVIAPAPPMIVKETGTVTALAPPVMVSIAMEVPVGNPEGLTLSVTLVGVVPTVPWDGDTLSQVCDDVTIKPVVAVLVKARVWGLGVVPPAVCVNVNDVGDGVMTLVVVDAVTVTVTETSTSAWPPVIAMMAP
jgi:hypothetical protein